MRGDAVVDVGLGDLDRGHELGDLELVVLERADRLAEGLALLGVLDRLAEDLEGVGGVGRCRADALEDVEVRLDADTIKVRWTAGGAEQPVAFPVNLLLFEYYALDGTLLATAAGAATAARVKFTVAVERPHSAVLLRRESWVYIRN